VIRSMRSGERVGNDPWDAFTLEWDTSSPPPHYNFETIPVVRSRRPFYDKKNPEIADWKTATH
jgi:heme/copper-type cytochrome/quinol oxidase subunit 1